MSSVFQTSDPKELEFPIGSFAGGVNIRDAVNLLQPDELRRGENILLDERGGAAKRLGGVSLGTFGSAADRVLSMYTFYRPNQIPQMLMHTSAGILYYTADATTNPIIWVQITTGLSTTQPLSYETFVSKVWMCDGVSNYASWDGSAYVTYPSAPKGKYLRLWKDTMWVSGIAGSPDRVYSSNPGDPTTYGVSSWVDIAKGDGDLITALATDEIFLIPFKRNRSFVIYDPVVFSNRIADHEKGCESHASCIHFENNLYFLTRRGICQWHGDAPAVILSSKLDPLFQPSILNLSALYVSNAYTIGNRVGWNIPEVGFIRPTMQIEYYPRLAQKGGPGPFVFHRVPGVYASLYRSGGVELLIIGHATANKCLRPEGGLDDGTPFQALAETGAFDLGDRKRNKYIRRLRFLGRGRFQVQLVRNFGAGAYASYTVDLTAAADIWSLGDLWGVGTWGPDSYIKEALVNTDAYCRYMAFRFIDAETTTGTNPIPVGSREYALTAGEWGIFGVLVDGVILGVRE
jgi:hypothetical protein